MLQHDLSSRERFDGTISIFERFMHCCCLSLAHMIVLHALLPIPNHPRPYHKCFLALPSFVRKSEPKGKENRQLSFRARTVFPSHAFAHIIQNRIFSSNLLSF